MYRKCIYNQSDNAAANTAHKRKKPRRTQQKTGYEQVKRCKSGSEIDFEPIDVDDINFDFEPPNFDDMDFDFDDLF